MQRPATPAGARSRGAVAVFALLFAAHAWFFQGGGWNANARFDQVRAIVEQGRLAVDDYLLYAVVPAPRGGLSLARRPLPPGMPADAVLQAANSGDLAVHDGSYYPNKPPGTVLLAVPAYLGLHLVERAAGLDPDDWRVMDWNAFVCSALSVGLIGALAGVLFLRLSRALWPELPFAAHAASALSLGLGTLMLPFSTMLFDHVEAAALLLAAFALLFAAREAGPDRSAALRRVLAAGVVAGAAVVVNYLAVVLVALLGIYALATLRPRLRVAGAFVLGGIPAVLLLAAYHTACFGSPLAIANTFQNRMFTGEGLMLGVFGVPRPAILFELLLGTRRGLLLTSPVLLLGMLGLAGALREGRRRAEALLALSCFLALWLANASFREWHAGFSIGPRYLIPALPLLALPAARLFARAPRRSAALALVSVAIALTVTAVDPQAPPRFSSPLTQYTWPLLRSGVVVIQDVSIDGPVSANPIGVYEPWYYRRFPRGSPQVRQASFNLGELLFPGSRLSLVPLLLLLAAGTLALLRGQQP